MTIYKKKHVCYYHFFAFKRFFFNFKLSKDCNENDIFQKSKLKKSDNQTNIEKYREATNIMEYVKMFKMDEQTF